MSATDSDNSIDWLASDNEEDDESERREPDCTGRPGLTEEGASSSPPPGSTPPSCPPLGPPSGGWLLRRQLEDDGGRDCSDVSKKASSRGAPLPSRYTGTTQDDDARGLCNTQQGERSNGRNTTQHALKRSRSPVAGQRNDRILLISTESEKDHVFTHKCMELQCYIHPLSLILNGLRSGRYRERLSSFQESVAMDRIQRIMGVLQNPCMGEKYVNIILKMEEMLKSWFPNVKPRDQHANTPTQTAEDSTPSKKLKLSPVTTALSNAAASPVQASILPVTKAKTLRVTDLTPPGAYSASNLKWLHTSPICSPMSAEQAQAGPRHHLLPPRDRALTQDSAVSSTTDSSSRAKTDSMVVPRGGPPPLGKINAPCLERLLKSTESIITRKDTAGDMMDNNSWS